MLSEKTDLENTEAFNKESVKDLRKLSTKDINGKDFTSKDFEKYDLTMVNVFATWCTACVKEIPDLVEVQNEMKSKGVNIVGVVTDPVDDNGENKEAIEKSKLIHEKTKASYPFLMPDKTNFNGRLNGIQAMPETFFVDSNGETKVVLDKAIRICMECIGMDRIKNIINGSTKKDKYKIRDRFKHLFQLRIAIIWSVSDVDDKNACPVDCN